MLVYVCVSNHAALVIKTGNVTVFCGRRRLNRRLLPDGEGGLLWYPVQS